MSRVDITKSMSHRILMNSMRHQNMTGSMICLDVTNCMSRVDSTNSMGHLILTNSITGMAMFKAGLGLLRMNVPIQWNPVYKAFYRIRDCGNKKIGR